MTEMTKAERSCPTQSMYISTQSHRLNDSMIILFYDNDY